MENPPSKSGTPQEAQGSCSELGRLTEALRVLESLSSPVVSPTQLAQSVTNMPKLTARVAREFHRCFADRAIPPSLGEQLEALGRKRFEELLYGYLEELTLSQGEEP